MSDWRVRDDLPHKPYRPMDHRTPYRLTDESAARLQQKMIAFCDALGPIMAILPDGPAVEVSFMVRRDGDKVLVDYKSLTFKPAAAG